MGKCNLLRPLNLSNGNYDGGTFFLFSQYADDLTRQNAQGDAYQVVPSRFAAFDIDYSGHDDKWAGEIFQNCYEHCCSMYRHMMANDTEPEQFDPEHSAALFWQAMTKLGYTAESDKLKFVGKSDVCGTTIIDGDAFSEIYCFIPGSASPRMYHASSIDIEPSRTPDTSSSIIWGWTPTTYPTTTGLSYNADPVNLENTPCPQTLKPIWQEYPGDLMHSHGEAIDNTVENTGWDEVETSDNYFNINTVAVFYDIVAKDEHGDYHYLYQNIPMGIYFTGPVDGDTLKNEVKKYISHDDIYGQGTAYGLRITTKFSAHPCLNTSCDEHCNAEVVYAGHSVSEAAAVIDSMRSAADAVMAAVSQNSAFNAELMNHLSEFRNKNTNIPYIRTVNGDDYWFVNGRNTGRRVNGVSATIQEIIERIWPEITEYIDDSMPDIDPTPGGKAYIEYIENNKYQDDATIAEIPQIEDYQDLYGNRCNYMFRGCSNLKRIPRLEVANAESMIGMFQGCRSINTINLSDSFSCSSFKDAFSGCKNLINLKIDALSANDFTGAFSGCTSLKNVIIDNIFPGSQANPRKLDFSDCPSISRHSIIRMIENVQNQFVDTQTDTLPSACVELVIPAALVNDFAVQTAAQLAMNNRGVQFLLHS